MDSENKRYVGIDVLRIVAIFMVLILHILGQGGILAVLGKKSADFFSKYNFVWLLEIASYCAVNCYATLTGYNYFQKKIEYIKLIELWFQVLFYSLLTTIIFALFGKTINSGLWFRSLFPIMSSMYWYATAYFGMFFFIPVMNEFLKRTSYKLLKDFFVILFIVFSIIPTVFMVNPFYLQGGYSMIWLIMLFLLGGFIKKYEINKSFTCQRALFFYVTSVLITWITKISLRYLNGCGVNLKIFNKVLHENFLINYTSPTIILAGVFIVVLCLNLQVKSKLFNNTMKILAPATFGVYLIHLHPIIWREYIKNFAVPYVNGSFIAMVIKIFGTAIVAYIIFALIDLLRIKLFDLLNVKLFSQKINRLIVTLLK